MTTNLLVTLVWTLATNEVVLSRVLTKQLSRDYIEGSSVLGVDSGTITRTTRYEVTSNLFGHFQLMGQKGSIHLNTLPVTNWTVTTIERPNFGYSMTLEGQPVVFTAPAMPGVGGTNTLESLSITTP